jgi:hypothetical protein
MLEDAQVSVLLTQQKLLAGLPEYERTVSAWTPSGKYSPKKAKKNPSAT